MKWLLTVAPGWLLYLHLVSNPIHRVSPGGTGGIPPTNLNICPLVYNNHYLTYLWKMFMKHKTYSWNIYIYQLRYLNGIKRSQTDIKKNFQALKYDLPIYKLHKVFACLTDFPNVIGKPQKLCKVVGKFYKLH